MTFVGSIYLQLSEGKRNNNRSCPNWSTDSTDDGGDDFFQSDPEDGEGDSPPSPETLVHALI